MFRGLLEACRVCGCCADRRRLYFCTKGNEAKVRRAFEGITKKYKDAFSTRDTTATFSFRSGLCYSVPYGCYHRQTLPISILRKPDAVGCTVKVVARE